MVRIPFAPAASHTNSIRTADLERPTRDSLAMPVNWTRDARCCAYAGSAAENAWMQGATADCNWRRPSGGCPLSTWDLLSRLCYGRETERRGVRSLSEVNRGGVLRHPPPRVRRQR